MARTESVKEEQQIVKEEQQIEKQQKEERVSFKIPMGSTDKDRADVFVAVNGKSYLIKRGIINNLPKSVVEVLENAEEQMMYAIEYQDSVKNQVVVTE